jgi:ATP-dependent Clp protease ATP-binding subunit ClpA
LCKALAEFLFDSKAYDPHRYVGFMEKHSVGALIGAPPVTSVTKKAVT